MSVVLTKNKPVNLSKESNGSKNFEVRLAWDINNITGESFDLDVSALICNASKKALSDNHFVFYNNLASPNKEVVHSGDNRTGDGDGWDEVMTINFDKMSNEVDTIPVIVSIFDAQQGQSFGSVSNVKVEVFDLDNQKAVAEFYPELENDSDTMMVVGEFINKNGSAFFKALGNGSNEGMPKALSAYGILAQ